MKSRRRFVQLSFTTLAAVYFLILVGGIVRSTGSGMGCPDWPKCFGSWVPPTEVSQLPADYKDVYAEKRRQKNVRLANYFSNLGFADLSYQIAHDPAIYHEATFNPVKTWIEYVNRLIGVVIGLLIVATAFTSVAYWQTNRNIVWLSFSALLATIVQGWIGSIVVSTNLLPWMISLHMAIAVGIIALLVRISALSVRMRLAAVPSTLISAVRPWLVVLVVLMSAQILLGTQVREEIDQIAARLSYMMRDTWIEQLSGLFEIHRSSSIIITLLTGYVAYRVYKMLGVQHWFTRLGLWSVGLIGTEIALGIVMAYFAIPAFAQPAHLLIATLTIGTLLFMIWAARPTVTSLSVPNETLSKVSIYDA